MDEFKISGIYFRFFNSPIHSGNFNPQIIVRRKSDNYDMGVYQIQKQRIIKIYDRDNQLSILFHCLTMSVSRFAPQDDN